MLMVSGDFPHVKFGPLWLVYENGTALSVLVVSKTAPCPLLRFEHESAFYRILMHVAKFLRTLVESRDFSCSAEDGARSPV
jgi:hypothetical protein